MVVKMASAMAMNDRNALLWLSVVATVSLNAMVACWVYIRGFG